MKNDKNINDLHMEYILRLAKLSDGDRKRKLKVQLHKQHNDG